MRISPKIFQVVGAVAYLVTAQTGFSASTFLGEAYPSQTTHSVEAYQPFASTLNYRWGVEPGNYFLVDTMLVETNWYLSLYLGHDMDVPGMTIRELIITLEGETGNLQFARSETINELWSATNGLIWRDIPITAGAGTFTAINFALSFENFPTDRIGQRVEPLIGGSYAPSFFEIRNDIEGARASVVPEPSAGALLMLGIGGVIALRRCRRSVV